MILESLYALLNILKSASLGLKCNNITQHIAG